MHSSLPWDQTTLLGYFGELMVIIAILLAYFTPTNTLLILFISMCFYHRAFYEIFKHTIDQFERQTDDDKCESKSINDLIRFRISVKE